MGNRAEELRKQTLAGGGAPARHSMNQKTTGYTIQAQERGFDRKAARAREKRERQMKNLQKFQFNRALGNVFNGMPIEDIMDLAPENIVYVLNHIDSSECLVETHKTEKGTASITIVDFTRSPSKPLQ